MYMYCCYADHVMVLLTSFAVDELQNEGPPRYDARASGEEVPAQATNQQKRHMKSTQEGRASSMQHVHANMHVHVVLSMLLTILGLTWRLGAPSPHRPTKFSSTELFPALCPPITAIWGRSMGHAMPRPEKASCS